MGIVEAQKKFLKMASYVESQAHIDFLDKENSTLVDVAVDMNDQMKEL